ncbi:M12 family metallopeptidase [Lacinutrix sp. MEBiC02595]
MCKGICTTKNRNVSSINDLLTENTHKELEKLITNDYFKNLVNADLTDKINRSKSDNTTILLESSNSENSKIINELCIWNSCKWENGQTITVKFLDNDFELEKKIKRYAKEWEEYANIHFNFVEEGDSDIRISLVQNFESWSYLGKECLKYPQNKATMNFGWFFNDTSDNEIRRVTLHEFGHALGCIHEHQHPKNQIPWDEKAVMRVYQAVHKWSEEQIRHNIFNQFPPEQLSNSEYDSNSIMHYFFPKILTLDKREFKENFELSEKDKKFIGICYPK